MSFSRIAYKGEISISLYIGYLRITQILLNQLFCSLNMMLISNHGAKYIIWGLPGTRTQRQLRSIALFTREIKL